MSDRHLLKRCQPGAGSTAGKDALAGWCVCTAFFREDLAADQTIVLVDSRTGVTEDAGICTHHLADLVVLLSAANDINIEGTKWMASTIAAADLDALRGGRPLQVMPVAARVETASQVEELAAFRERFEREFAASVPAAAGGYVILAMLLRR